MFLLVFIILGAILAYAGWTWLVKNKKLPGGFLGVLAASLIGVWLGDQIFANFFWVLANVNVIGGIIFSLILMWVWVLIAGK